MTPFPSTVDIKALDSQHPDYTANQRLYEDLKLLYEGSVLLKANAARFLVKRVKELGAVYQSRLNKLTYDNLIQSICSWFTAKLFENDVEIDFKIDGADKVHPFYAELLEDCDNANTSLESFFEKLAADGLLYGRAHYLIDLPRLDNQPATLAEQESLGGLNPYFVYFDPCSITNWQTDAFGNYEWVLTHTLTVEQAFLQKAQTVERWTYYDKTQYTTYEARYEGTSRPTQAKLIAQGPHAMSAQGEVALHCIDTEQLWLGKRIYLPLIEYFNQDNSYAWSLWMANNPTPVFVQGKDNAKLDENQTVAEYSAMILPEGAKFEWAEPQGKSWEASQRRLDSMRENIYRMCHLIAQGRSTKGSALVQSSLAKELDMSPAADVLNIFGNLMRNAIQDSLEDVAAIRGAKVSPDVRGMNFSEDGASATVDLTLQTKSLNIPSVTLNKELNKKVARTVLRDANPDLIQKIVNEIESAPDAAQTTVVTDAVSLNVSERTTPQ